MPFCKSWRRILIVITQFQNWKKQNFFETFLFKRRMEYRNVTKSKQKQKKREPNQIATKYNTSIIISIFIPNAYVVHRFWFHKRRLIQRKSNKIFIPNKIFLPLLLQNIALLKFFISFTSGAFFRHYISWVNIEQWDFLTCSCFNGIKNYYLLNIGLTVQSLAK